MTKQALISTIAYLLVSQNLSAEESSVKVKIEEKLPAIKAADSSRLIKLIEDNFDEFSPETLDLVKKISDRRATVTINREVSVPNLDQLTGISQRPRPVEIFGNHASPKDQAGH